MKKSIESRIKELERQIVQLNARPVHTMNVIAFDPHTGTYEATCPICGRREQRGPDTKTIIWYEGDPDYKHDWSTGGAFSLSIGTPEIAQDQQ